MKFNHLLQSQEGKTLEFKQDLSSPANIMKTLVAFANTAGGIMLIGIKNDRTVVGIQGNPLDEEERLSNMIADSIAPRLIPNIELVPSKNLTLLAVEVFPSQLRPHYLKQKGEQQGVFVRLGSTNRQADLPLIEELKRTVTGKGFDELPMLEADAADIDFQAVTEAFRSVRSLAENDMVKLRLLTSVQGRLVPTVGGMLLFGKRRDHFFPDAWIQCGRFIGTEKVDIFDHIDINVSLPVAVDEIMTFLKKHAMRSADFSEIRRRDVWSIPLTILREAIINAIVHADYSQRGAPIRIVFLDDRIEIENPGILLPGLTIEDMKQGMSKIRNHVIARLFRELDLIEQWGTGVRRMFQEAEQQGLPEPEIVEIGMRIRTIIYLAETTRVGPVEQSGHTRAHDEAHDEAHDLSKTEKLILQACQDGPLSVSQLLNVLGYKSRTGHFKKALSRLLELELLVRTVPDAPRSKKQKYRINA
jgi:predicted HTH transcriptional regulator